MQKFEYRTPRFSADLPVEFAVANATLFGRCKEISKDGMTLEVRLPLVLNSIGIVSIAYQGQTVEVRARVAHVEATRGGLVFLYESDIDRGDVARLVTALAAPQNHPGPVLLH